jgi:Peptidase A4 family
MLAASVAMSVVAVAGAFASTVTEVASPPRATAYPLGSFAGYAAVTGQIGRMTGEWRVPVITPKAIASSREPGEESTWIGAEDIRADQAPSFPFVQIGTVGIETKLATLYLAFWSDTAVGFLPQFMGLVKPGDLVHTVMQVTATGWELKLDDITARRLVTTLVRDEPTAGYTSAQWIQEDPSSGVGPSVGRAPYPRTSLASFFDVNVNGAPPRVSFKDESWLGFRGAIAIRPTPLEGDSFQLEQTIVGGPARQYLGDVAPYDDDLGVFASEIFRWNAKTSRETMRSQAAPVLRELLAFEHDLVDQSWPSSALVHIPLLVARVQAEARIVRSLPSLDPRDVPTWRLRFSSSTVLGGRAALGVRFALGIP